MPNKALTSKDVKEILQKNGIENIDQLANLIANKSASNASANSINAAGDSWVIKVWKLKPATKIALPDNLGGNILKNAGF